MLSYKNNWSGREDLNLRPPTPHAGALPDCATPRIIEKYNILKGKDFYQNLYRKIIAEILISALKNET